jgi:hypothetical protein
VADIYMTTAEVLAFNKKAIANNIMLKKRLEQSEREIFARRREALKQGRVSKQEPLANFDLELIAIEKSYLKKLKPTWRKYPGYKDGYFEVILNTGLVTQASYFGYKVPPKVKIEGEKEEFTLERCSVSFWGIRLGEPKHSNYWDSNIHGGYHHGL